jgi:transposase
MMPRQPLDEISGNSNYKGGVRGRFELTPHWRSHIAGRAAAGQSQKEIAKDLSLHPTTVQYTLDQAAKRYKNEILHRSDRPKIVSESLRRRLLREVHANPKIRYKDLRLNLDLDGKTVSRSTLYRILKEEGITNWLAKKRPLLTPEVVAKRLQFAKEHEHWGPHEWKAFLWSDECSVERGSGKKRQWVFRTPAQKWDKEMIQPYNKDKNKSVMVWACFGGDN